MKFGYKDLGGGVLRPIIPVEIEAGNALIRYEALVDSGADICIFPGEIGEALGLDVEYGKEQKVAGVTGTVEPYYIHPVTIKVGGWPYEIEAGFYPNMGPRSYGVVGQRGFFEHFIVRFDYQKAEIQIAQKKN